jgi:hypothetical protein
MFFFKVKVKDMYEIDEVMSVDRRIGEVCQFYLLISYISDLYFIFEYNDFSKLEK